MTEYVKASNYVDEIIDKYPSTVKYFSEKGIVCVQCGEPVWGTVKDMIAKKYDDVDAVIKELNEYIDKNK